MKRIGPLLIAAIMVAGMAGCSSNDEPELDLNGAWHHSYRIKDGDRVMETGEGTSKIAHIGNVITISMNTTYHDVYMEKSGTKTLRLTGTLVEGILTIGPSEFDLRTIAYSPIFKYIEPPITTLDGLGTVSKGWIDVQLRLARAGNISWGLYFSR
jgi:hypothetical protein